MMAQRADAACATEAPAKRRLKSALALAVASLGALAGGVAEAGRPLGTDDASTVESGCQIEAWAEHAKEQDAYVLAPACAAGPGLEVGADLTRYRPPGETYSELGLGLKWAPAAGELSTVLGDLHLGLKLGLGAARTQDVGWKSRGYGALALASLELSPSLSLHFNIGPDRNRESGATTTLANLALAWSPSDAALVFAEVMTNDRRNVNGGAVRSAGARWWLSKDVFGLDLTASRAAGSNATVWSLGFGWYGLGAK